MKKIALICSCVFLFFLIFMIYIPKNVFSEVVILHANQPRLRTDIILRGSSTITWEVKEDDYWSFNPEMFPEGHNADGIPIPALEYYVLPGENLGKLLGQIGDGRIIPMGLSGSAYIRPDEEGNYLYLTINDELFHIHGKGFQDNTGEIKVTITQTPRKTTEINLLFIKGCTGSKFVMKYIEEIVVNEALDAEINLIEVRNDEDARNLHFTGSPTIRVNGEDVEKNYEDTRDYGVRCRLYYIEGKVLGHPSKSIIEDSIKKAK